MSTKPQFIPKACEKNGRFGISITVKGLLNHQLEDALNAYGRVTGYRDDVFEEVNSIIFRTAKPVEVFVATGDQATQFAKNLQNDVGVEFGDATQRQDPKALPQSLVLAIQKAAEDLKQLNPQLAG